MRRLHRLLYDVRTLVTIPEETIPPVVEILGGAIAKSGLTLRSVRCSHRRVRRGEALES